MIAFINEDDRSLDQWAELPELDRFERIGRPRHGEFPVRSQASQTRARMRSRGRAGARRKARGFNGAHRRGCARRVR
jgi:hypothetical protein